VVVGYLVVKGSSVRTNMSKVESSEGKNLMHEE